MPDCKHTCKVCRVRQLVEVVRDQVREEARQDGSLRAGVSGWRLHVHEPAHMQTLLRASMIGTPLSKVTDLYAFLSSTYIMPE